MTERKKAFLFLHISVFLFGFTAILGDIIEVNFISIVWWRSITTAFFLLFIIRITDFKRVFTQKIIIQQIIIGFFLAIHWLFFYGSIKVSNPTMALIALSSSSLMTAFLEPLMVKKAKWNRIDFILSLMIIPGFMLIFYNSNSLQQYGLGLGLVATFLGTVFSILNKKWLVVGHEFKLTFIQMTTVFGVMSILLFIIPGLLNVDFEIIQGIDWFYMGIFALFCTVFAYYLYLKSMKKISAFDVSIAFNMEPIYGILMAALLLKDYKNMSILVYIGMIFITLVVFLDTFLKFKESKRLSK